MNSPVFKLPTEDCRLKNAKHNEISHFRRSKFKTLNNYQFINDHTNLQWFREYRSGTFELFHQEISEEPRYVY